MIVVENETLSYESANFTEDETLWLIGSVFDYADEIRYEHFIYKYAGTSGTNTTDNPEVDSISQTPTWVLTRPSNYFAMLDNKTSTQTENANTIVIEIACENYDNIALFELEGDSVTLELTDDSVPEVVYTREFDLQDETSIIDFYSYCFSPFVYTPTIYANDIPLYGNATMKITIDNTGETAKCGRLVFGRSFYVGDTGYGANLSLESFSSKETDEFGNVTLVHRDSINLDSYEVQIPTNKLPVLKRKAQELDAIAVLFVMDESEDSNVENLLTFGYWDNFSMILPNPVKSTISLTIKGLV